MRNSRQSPPVTAIFSKSYACPHGDILRQAAEALYPRENTHCLMTLHDRQQDFATARTKVQASQKGSKYPQKQIIKKK